MEMLIVVAIIGVLVAVAIPLFGSQLEKSREAVDLANVRAAYADVLTASMLGQTAETVKVVKLKQQQDAPPQQGQDQHHCTLSPAAIQSLSCPCLQFPQLHVTLPAAGFAFRRQLCIRRRHSYSVKGSSSSLV